MYVRSIVRPDMPSNSEGHSTEIAASVTPWRYLPFFFKILKYFENKTFSRESISKTVATKGYIHRKIHKIFDQQPLSNSFSAKLNAKIRERINGKQNKEWDKNTIERLTASQMSSINALITKVIPKINAKTFKPKTFTDPRGCRRFTMVPIHSLRNRHICIDYQTLCKLAGIPVSIFKLWLSFLRSCLTKASLMPRQRSTTATVDFITATFDRFFRFERLKTISHQDDVEKKHRIFQQVLSFAEKS